MQTPVTNPLIRVVLVEDDVDFQQMLRQMIDDAPDMELLTVASTREQGMRALEMLTMDVLLVDLGLPDGSGIELIRAAHLRQPQCGVMVCTVFGDEIHVMQSLEAGATGYLLKDSPAHSMVGEIRSLHRGGSPISPLIARQVLTRFREKKLPQPASAPPKTDATRPLLSARELEVLELITKGFTADEIAELLSVSRHTVHTFVRRIYSKLHVNSKAEAIFEARNQGLIGN
ncbi:response regulator transcription factor [Duganella sp. sic0402]|uniref:response regulator transcription factor n=1 Tax=Duganella sp. sic0402 TaxID=2854786 RepID=UPI001C468AA2|nr:response regulator transcription factor [Duganella sp. sic0402]MBV7537517.1 response regulator transcription factor [Duganella sp. sic0402]